MIEEEMQVNADYQKGFNNGYILAKQEPELFEQLMKTPNEGREYFTGLKAGGKEYLKEKFKTDLQHDRGQANQKDKDRDRGL